MSRDELVSAYLDGGVSRRVFIRRLVAAGISFGAAVSYAHLLDPHRASASGASAAADYYTPPGVSVGFKSKDLDKVARKEELRVVVGVDEAAAVDVFAEGKLGGKFKLIGQGQVVFPGAGEQVVDIPLNKRGRKAAKRREKLQVRLIAGATDLQGDVTLEELKRKLKS